MIYTLTLNPSLDYTMNVCSFSEGKINRSQSEEIAFGGKGLNVSAMLGNLGTESVALGFCGGFTGKEIKRLVKNYGIRCDFCEIRDMSRINVKIAGEKESAVNGKGPFIRIEEESALLEKLSALSSEDTVVISGKSPESESGRLLSNVLDATSHTRLVADMEGADLEATMLRKPFLIKPNYSELCGLFKKSEMNEEELCSAAGKLLSHGVKNILLSLGEKGAMLFTEERKVYRIRAPRVDVKSSVAAGDSLLAGFLAGYERGAELALALGVAAGSASVACTGIADSAAVMHIFSQM